MLRAIKFTRVLFECKLATPQGTDHKWGQHNNTTMTLENKLKETTVPTCASSLAASQHERPALAGLS